MAETYCLKSCTECGREGCTGCRAGAFAQQCEIVKCCREKNHESCGSCTNQGFCGTRASRDLMPEKVFAMQRREEELALKYRADAAVLGKWTRVMFWCLIAMNVFSLVGLVPAFHWIERIGSGALVIGAFYGMLQMRSVDERFRTVALVQIGIYFANILAAELLGEDSGLLLGLRLVIGTVGIYVVKMEAETFRDSLSGISRELSGKWERQWVLYKISLFLCLGGLAVSIVLGILGLLAVIAALGLLLFVDIREYVYLYQTAALCRGFAGEKNCG